LFHEPNAAGVRVYGNNIRNGTHGISVAADVSGLKIWRNDFSSLRYGIYHHHSNGTLVWDNSARSVRYPVFSESSRNLTVYGNDW
jgi:nitrous oxidase accessory protein NosD